MSGTLLLVALVLVAAGGAIAYIGDMIGKRLGKRRVSVLGLRPRSTAILISTATGIVIALVSLGALLLFSSSFREAITRYDSVKADISKARADLRKAQAGLADARAAAEAAEQSRQAAETHRAEAEAEAEAAIGERNQAQQETAEAVTDRDSAIAQRDEAQEQLDATLGDLGSAKAELATVQAELQSTLARLQNVLGEYSWETLAARPITFLKGEELARVIVTSNMEADEVRAALLALKGASDDIAKEQGAAPIAGLDPEQRYTVFSAEEDANAEAQMLLLTPNHEAREAYLELAVERITELFDTVPQVVARLVAEVPAPEGRPVLVTLAYGPVKRVISAGEAMAQLDIDSSLSYDDIVLRLQELGSRVRDAALVRGMVTPPGGAFGSLLPSEIDRLVRAIQGRTGTVRVVVRAKRDIKNIDPLDVQFEVAR